MQPQNSRRANRRQNGQTTVFMALFVTTLLLLFAFTTNIGMLVHAKINLQNAADAAAYAGASVQARQLTSIAYLNWEMRRAIKEFLYLYQVKGNRSQECFPQNPNGDNFCGPPGATNRRYNFSFFNPTHSFDQLQEDPNQSYIPTVCVIFSKDENPCKLAGVPGVPIFPGNGSFGIIGDPIVRAVKNATDLIIQQKITDCEAKTNGNRIFLTAWLYNPDPELAAYNVSTYVEQHPFSVTGLDGLGLIPRLALLRARMDHLEDTVNLNLRKEGYSATIDASLVDTLKLTGKDLNYFERPIQAFLSAKNNLPEVGGDDGIFAEIRLSELLPTDGPLPPSSQSGRSNPSTLLKLNEITQTVSVANSFFEKVPSATGPNQSESCMQRREIRTIENLPLGVVKDPSIITYYAVRLEAKVRLLFSPFSGEGGMVSISAYSAAKPFGSRIGPDISKSLETTAVAIGKTFQGEVIDQNTPRFLNPLIAGDDVQSDTQGFTRIDHLGYLNQATQIWGWDTGQRLAGAYAPWEIGFFTVPANYKDPEGIDLNRFPGNPKYDSATNGRFQLRAPITKVSGGGLEHIREHIEGMIRGKERSKNEDLFKGLTEGLLSDNAFNKLFAYLDKNNLQNYHLIPDPMLYDAGLKEQRAYARSYGQKFTVTADSANGPQRQLTSWNNRKSTTEFEANGTSEMSADTGRGGYSVRFVSFKTLRQGGQSSNDRAVTEQYSDPFQRMDAGSIGDRILEDISLLSH